MQPFNKYYPPDWTPDKGSANKFVGKHPLGDRARKIDKGILIVRFELPFNIWCEGCDNHIGMGKYNFCVLTRPHFKSMLTMVYRRSVQCGEEKDWKLLFYTYMAVSNEMPLVQYLD